MYSRPYRLIERNVSTIIRNLHCKGICVWYLLFQNSALSGICLLYTSQNSELLCVYNSQRSGHALVGSPRDVKKPIAVMEM